MKTTGIVRHLDDLGRLCIPKEMRSILNINTLDSIEFFVEDDTIILKKHSATCVFCGSQDNLTSFKKNKICDKCKEELTK